MAHAKCPMQLDHDELATKTSILEFTEDLLRFRSRTALCNFHDIVDSLLLDCPVKLQHLLQRSGSYFKKQFTNMWIGVSGNEKARPHCNEKYTPYDLRQNSSPH